MQSGQDKALLSRFGLEIIGALFVIGFGGSMLYGAAELPVAWGADGPDAGTLPFWLGVIVIGAGLFILGQALRERRALLREGVLGREAAIRLARFGLPIVLFVALIMPLGLYAAMGLYLFGMLRWQGHRWRVAIFAALACIVFSWFAFENWFDLPLPKGPIEAWLGLD